MEDIGRDSRVGSRDSSLLGVGSWDLGFGENGPPGDRTQDTVIKSHVLYH
jgi:hypothetical protein